MAEWVLIAVLYVLGWVHMTVTVYDDMDIERWKSVQIGSYWPAIVFYCIVASVYDLWSK